MHVNGKSIIVTGAAQGIGAALARRFAADGAALVVVSDIDARGAEHVAAAIRSAGGDAIAQRADVASEADIQALADLAVAQQGRIDLFCSNAGLIVQGGPDAADAAWTQSWQVNVMAHVHAARIALPAMLERGEGYFLNTASSAGLLTALGAAPYATSKHAAVGFAEWLAITYGGKGIGVSVLCPQAVRTKMLEDAMGGEAGKAVQSAGAVLEPDDVAQMVTDALAARRFMIHTHAEVTDYMKRKAGDIDRWIGGMQRFAAASGQSD